MKNIDNTLRVVIPNMMMTLFAIFVLIANVPDIGNGEDVIVVIIMTVVGAAVGRFMGYVMHLLYLMSKYDR